ncbi:MAG: hypothetical protein J3K34DRAFT_447059 [Monoraphidium minutum]|nr:MAG: hypothetical protein J3K34DRAFT_447059 [Monoraphidium minutum]
MITEACAFWGVGEAGPMVRVRRCSWVRHAQRACAARGCLGAGACRQRRRASRAAGVALAVRATILARENRPQTGVPSALWKCPRPAENPWARDVPEIKLSILWMPITGPAWMCAGGGVLAGQQQSPAAPQGAAGGRRALAPRPLVPAITMWCVHGGHQGARKPASLEAAAGAPGQTKNGGGVRSVHTHDALP